MLVAVLMLMSSFAALADTVALDTSVSVTGLDVGDVVKFYKVIEWDQSSGWGFTSEFAGLKTSGLDTNGDVIGYSTANTPTGKTVDQAEIQKDVLKYIAGIPGNLSVGYGEDGSITRTPQAAILGRINSELAAKIADLARSATVAQQLQAAGEGTNGASVTWSVSTGTNGKAPEAGLYVALVTPKITGTVYNPIFVAADFDATNAAGHANTQAAILTESYSDVAMAKKTVIDLKKTIDEDPDTADSREDRAKADDTEGYTATSVDVGEILKFKVVTTIPEYNSTYTNATFTITDKLNGLALVIEDPAHPFTVKAGETVISTAVGGPKDSQYTKIPANNGTSYEIDFTSTYILGLDAATPIEITYFAKITDEATKVVNPTDNTVKVEYSNNPGDLDSKGTLIDRTNQYSFSIDANINGLTNKTSSELIKVGVDKNGQPVYDTVNLENGQTNIPALEGATFALLTAAPGADSTLIGKNATELAALNDAEGAKIYSNTLGKAITTSSSLGKLNFKGLDAGKYYLVETKAPEGFIRDTKVYEITITPEYNEVTHTETIGGIEVTCKSEVLKKYTVTVKDNSATPQTVTSVYEPKNFGTEEFSEHIDNPTTQNTNMDFTNISNHVEGDSNFNGNADHTTLLVNTKGIELPSTGGMGTTILYIGGSILVILAAVLLITKRRMNAED